MKKIWMVPFLLLTFLSYSQEIIGRLTLIQKQVLVTRNEKTISPSVGDDIYDSDIIETGDESFAEISLQNESGIIRVEENSKMAISSYILEEDRNYSLSLFSGSVGNNVQSRSSESDIFNVTTSTMSVGVRGTDFTVTAAASGDSLVTVKEGQVAAGEVSSEGDMEDEGYNTRTNEVNVGKGESAQKLTGETGLKKRDITPEQWREEREQYLKENPEKVLLYFEQKSLVLGKQIKRVKRANEKIADSRKKLNRIFKDLNDQIDDLDRLPRHLRKKAKKKLLDEYIEKMRRINRVNRKVLKSSRVLLDEFWAAREAMLNIMKKIEAGELEVKDKELFELFKKRLSEVKKVTKDARALEVVWRTSIRDIREDGKRLKKY